MASIDTRNRKPRRARGTPLFKLRYYAAGALGLYTLIFGTIAATSPFMRETRESMDIIRDIFQETKERKSRIENPLEEEMESLHKVLKAQFGNQQNASMKEEK